MWWLHRNPEGLESDLRTKIGQNGISSGVGRQDLKLLLCYLSEGRKLLRNTRNRCAITRGDSPSLKTVGTLFPSGQLGLALMSVASPSQIGRKSLEDSYVTRHRKSVASHSWNFARVATFAEWHRYSGEYRISWTISCSPELRFISCSAADSKQPIRRSWILN